MNSENEQWILDELKKCGSLKEGHFVLTSGKHSSKYVQCALLFTNPKLGQKLCQNLAQKVIDKFGSDFADIIVAPAIGAIIMGYEMGNALNMESVFCERDKSNDQFCFKRDFGEKVQGKRVLIAEIVMSTGKSSLETIKCIEDAGGTVVGECVLLNRCSDKNVLPVPTVSLLNFDIPIFDADNLPEELKKIPAVYPGSRKKIIC